MKKLLILFLLVTVTSGVFAPQLAAQLNWSLTSQFNTQLFTRQTPLGERAEKTITVGDQTLNNPNSTTSTANNPVNSTYVTLYGITRGDYTYFSDSRNIFAYGRGGWGAGNYLYLNLGYSGDTVAFHTSVYLDRLINAYDANEGIGKDNFYAGGSEQSFVAGDGKTPNWSAVLRYAFEEWYVRGSAGIFTGYVGITPDRGKVQTFNNQNASLLAGTMVETYGVLAPDQDAGFVHDGLDTNNLLRSGAPHTTNLAAKFTSMPYFMVAARLENPLPFPLTIQIAADPGNNGGIGSDSSYRRIHGALRLSGENIGDHVNVDAIYKIAGGDPITSDDYDPVINPFGALQPDGTGFIIHNWGVYANILNVAGFGFGLGYSGWLKTYEDFKLRETGAVIPTTGPMFTGFDLRIRYTGIDKLVLTSFNNISYGKTDTASADSYVIGVTGVQLPNDSAQDWFALFNAFTVVYSLTDKLSVSAQIANRYGLITTEISSDEASEMERGRKLLGGGAYVAYRFSWCNLQIGFAFRRLYESYSNTGTPPVGSTQSTINSFRDASGGTFDIAIPIQLIFRF